MQTTLRLDDELYSEAKAEEARLGLTLTRFLEEGLRLRLQKSRSSPNNVPVRFRTYRQGRPFPFDDQRLKEVANREQQTADLVKLKGIGR